MMKLSTKVRYGVRFMMDLAQHGRGGNVALKEIARRQAISEKYLWQVVNPLKSSGLIRAVAGPGGGYALARAAASITLRDILSALEGEGSWVRCVDKPGVCSRSNACAAREMWNDVGERIGQVLHTVNLHDLAEKQRLMGQSESASYEI